MPDDSGVPDDIGAVSALADPVRRAAYRAVVAAGGPVGRDEVAGALGVGRTLAAFHLDKLVDAGLLEVSYARRSGRSGPGAGRPAKLYRRSAAEHAVSLPPREYRTAAELFAEAVERAGADATLYAVAREHGRRAATAGDDLVASLAKLGYEPSLDGSTVRLRNCPFHQLANEFSPLVCGMNLALLEGLAERIAPGCEGGGPEGLGGGRVKGGGPGGLGGGRVKGGGPEGLGGRVHARLDRGPTGCCVVLDF